MRKNQSISISALSPGGHQRYVKPIIKVLEMDIERCLLSGSDVKVKTPTVSDWGDDTNMGDGTVTDSDE
jgi:hypothetical protein